MPAVRLMVERMRRRLVTMGLTVEVSLKVHNTVGVLSLPEVGDHQAGWLEMVGKVASYSTIVASSRSELVIRPDGFLKLTRSSTISFGHCRRHT